VGICAAGVGWPAKVTGIPTATVADLNEDYIAKMEDVLETYKQPYDPKQPLVCLDEKPITLHADVRPWSPTIPGREARRDNEWMNRSHTRIHWKFDRKAARRKFGYKRNSFKRSQT
jgi:hypothetical protein